MMRHLSLFLFTAAAFAQAQFMNDVKSLADGHWQWNGWLTPKGRVIALFALLRLSEQKVWLLLPDADAAAMAQSLKRFVFRSKVAIDLREDWVIEGRHSDPFHYLGPHAEGDATVRAKAEAALAAGLTPIVCVGESEAQRLAGEAEAVVTGQLDGSLPDGFAGAGGVVAYEPVWAIGTGRTPTEPDIAAIHAAIRANLVGRFGAAGQGLRILYGGSVKPGNARAILALPHVDGALVGGASLVAADFLAIAAAAG